MLSRIREKLVAAADPQDEVKYSMKLYYKKHIKSHVISKKEEEQKETETTTGDLVEKMTVLQLATHISGQERKGTFDQIREENKGKGTRKEEGKRIKHDKNAQ